MAANRLKIQQRMFVADKTLDVALGCQVLFSGKHWREPCAADVSVVSRAAWIPSALFCRAEVFQRVGLFDPARQGPEFIAWCAEAMDLSISFSVAEQTVVYRRVHDNNLSRAQIKSTDEYPRLIKQILDRRRAA